MKCNDAKRKGRGKGHESVKVERSFGNERTIAASNNLKYPKIIVCTVIHYQHIINIYFTLKIQIELNVQEIINSK